MANAIEFYLRATKKSELLEKFMKETSINSAFTFSKLNDLEFVFLSKSFDYERVLEISQDSDSKIIVIDYNTSLGYIRKQEYSCGHLVSSKSTVFSLDIESDMFDLSEIKCTSFEKLLEDYIDKFGVEEISSPKVGEYVRINELTCSDEDILSWLQKQNKNKFRVSNIEHQSNGLWIENCEYRIDLSDCIVY